MQALQRNFLLLIAVFVIAGCGTAPPQQPVPTDPAQIVFQAHGIYAAGLRGLNQYKRLQTCGPEAPAPLCKSAARLKQLQDEDNKVFKQLSDAQAIVRLDGDPRAPAAATKAKVATDAFKKQADSLPKPKVKP